MKVYDFSFYAARRAEAKAAVAVCESVAQINRAGEVIQLKQKVANWYLLHCDVQQRLAGNG